MYYEEKVIDGQLCYRNAPDAPWAVVGYLDLVNRVILAERKVNTFEQVRDGLKVVANITDCHPIDADRRDRIHSIAQRLLALLGEVKS